MGDISAEPSMEDILSSIKRIIREEHEGEVPPSRGRGRLRPSSEEQPTRAREPRVEEVLELSDRAPEPAQPAQSQPAQSFEQIADAVRAAVPDAEAIVSASAAEASRDQLQALSRMIVKPDNGGSETLEGLVREMLRPMLRDWLDANLPKMVETMVAREIARITGRQG